MSDRILANLQTVAINTNASGNTVIIAGVSGKNVYIVGYVLVAANAVNVQFSDGAAGLCGAMPMIAGVPIVAPMDLSNFWMQTGAPSRGIEINLSTNVQVSGHLSYLQV